MPFDVGLYNHEYQKTIARIEDKSIKNQVDYIMKSGNFDAIYKKDGKVFFRFDEFAVNKGNPVAIIYSAENLDGKNNIIWHDECDGQKYTYESLGEGWYYEYRSW